eukprot:18088-Heterococcus_DN1.PRE.3
MTHITTIEFIVPGMSGDAVILITVAAAITGGDVIAVGQAALFLRGREDKGTGEHCSGLGELLDQYPDDCAIYTLDSVKPQGSVRFCVSERPPDSSLCGHAYGPLPSTLVPHCQYTAANADTSSSAAVTADIDSSDAATPIATAADATAAAAAVAATAAAAAAAAVAAYDTEIEAVTAVTVPVAEARHRWFLCVFESVLGLYTAEGDPASLISFHTVDVVLERGAGAVLCIRESSSRAFDLLFDTVGERERWLHVLAQSALLALAHV